jgi:hypothetical protein
VQTAAAAEKVMSERRLTPKLPATQANNEMATPIPNTIAVGTSNDLPGVGSTHPR